VLSKGTTVYQSLAHELRDNDAIKHRYLGV
jgi:ABC-type branched-subunit amino acid transport system ATPase component